IPRWTAIDESASVTVFAGELYGLTAPAAPESSWASDAAHGVCVAHVRLLRKGAQIVLPARASGVARALYVVEPGPQQRSGADDDDDDDDDGRSEDVVRVSRTGLPGWSYAFVAGDVEVEVERVGGDDGEPVEILVLEGC
ncbi:hypothetical protein HK405_002498, partial [Cladochytrium tenue]